jgi:cation diffusion facilitator CzcD-associated flavoprotein CzcO
MERTSLLIVGAGPYGLSTAACAKRMGIDPVLVGEPMGFWRRNMPEGMLLRSGIDWQLDPFQEYTFQGYLRDRGMLESDVTPIPVELFVEYGEWFREAYGLEVRPTLVEELCADDDHRFEAKLSDTEAIVADNVVAAPGVAYFANVPEEVVRSLDPARYSHTCTLTRFEDLRADRVLIVGGRQSAFEWAALISEQVGAEVHVVHDHETPAFEASDWSFVDGLIDKTLETRGWFRHLPPEEREAISKRFWSEGRLKLEPWLAERVARGNITDWPRTHVVEYRQEAMGEIVASLSNDRELVVDHVVLATGYRVRIPAVPYLARSHLARDLHTVDGCPVLDEDFQSNIAGLFFTGFTAARDFGPFSASCGAARPRPESSWPRSGLGWQRARTPRRRAPTHAVSLSPVAAAQARTTTAPVPPPPGPLDAVEHEWTCTACCPSIEPMLARSGRCPSEKRWLAEPKCGTAVVCTSTSTAGGCACERVPAATAPPSFPSCIRSLKRSPGGA